MTIKIEAAQRLVATHADTSAARRYIENTLGVALDELSYESDGIISFWIARNSDLDTVMESISKALNKKAKKLPRHGSPDQEYQWDIGSGRYVHLGTGFSHRLKRVLPMKITLDNGN